MDKVSKKLKRQLTFKKSDFNYTLRNERSSLGNLSNFTSSKNDLKNIFTQYRHLSYQLTFPVRVNKREPTDLTKKNIKAEDFSALNRDQNTMEMQLDFTKSLKLFKPDQKHSKNSKSNPFLEPALKRLKSSKEIPERRSLNSKLNPDKKAINRRNSEIEEKSDDLSIIDSRSDRSSESFKPNRNSLQNRQKKSIKASISEVRIFDFNEAISVFCEMPHVLVDVDLWRGSFLDKLCSCFKKTEDLSEEFLETCEKIIIFACLGYSSENSFHSSLMASCIHRLKRVLEEDSSLNLIGFSSDSPYESDLKHDIATFGLMGILFLCDFLPVTLCLMVKYCLSCDMAFVPLCFDIGELVILSLRKKTLNSVINKLEKCLESIFFFYAGCLSQWFILHKDYENNLTGLSCELEKEVNKDPLGTVQMAWNLLKIQF